MTPNATAHRALAAYGGAERWRAARFVRARATLAGRLFELKERRPVPDAAVVCEVHRPWTRIEPIDEEGRVGVLDGEDARLETSAGEVVESRGAAREALTGTQGQRAWDALDLTYFLGYAFWNYLALPALLLRDDVAWTELEDGLLESRFPPYLPTHSAVQRHRFDAATGLLARYEYRPEVVPEAAELWVANVVVERGAYEGVPHEARRRVTPLVDGQPQAEPVFVDLRFDDWRLE